MCLEAYTFTGDKYGLYASAALDRAASYVSGGKPVTWVEYGMNLTGMSGLAVGTKILWNAEDNRPLDSRLEEQRLYKSSFTKCSVCAMSKARSRGSTPAASDSRNTATADM